MDQDKESLDAAADAAADMIISMAGGTELG